MTKTPKRMAVRIRDALTLHALSADPEVRFRVNWKGSSASSLYHSSCAVEMEPRMLEWAQTRGMKVLAIKRDWSKWRAPCAQCRGAINVPSRKPEQNAFMAGGGW